MKTRIAVGTLLVLFAFAANVQAQTVDKRVLAKLSQEEARTFKGGARGVGEQVASDNGRHIALLRPVGSRFVVELDGTASQQWDQVGGLELEQTHQRSPSGAFQFSPDGSRLAYVAREGARIVLVVGQQVTPIEPADIRRAGFFSFSPNGSRYAMVVRAPHRGQAWIVVDGIKHGPYGDVRDVTFSGDGKHIAYVTHQSPFENQRAGVKVVLDGKESPAYARVNSLNLSFDGSRAVYASEAMYQERTEGWRVVVDGKPSATRYAAVKLLQMSANGKRVAFVGSPTTDGVNYVSEQIVIDGKASKNYKFVHELKLSPDGSRYGARAMIEIPGSSESRAVFVVDGTESKDYPEIGMVDTIFFTADSKRVAIDRLTFMLIDGREYPGAGMGQGHGIRVGPKGSSLAYRTKEDDNIVRVFINGKQGPDLVSADLDALVFTPDGTNAAYPARDVAGKALLVTADKTYSVPDSQLGGFYLAKDKPRIPLVWSPDGAHFATIIGRNLYFDGRQAEQCLFGWLPTFSADSKHFAVACAEPQQVLENYAIHVDGQRVLVTEAVFKHQPGTMKFTDDGTLETYGLIGQELTALRIGAGAGLSQMGSQQGSSQVSNTAAPAVPAAGEAPTGAPAQAPGNPQPEDPAKAVEKAVDKARDALKKLPGIFKKKE